MAAMCSSCGARITWVKTTTGGNMPLDVELVAGGNIDLVGGIAAIVTPNPEVRRYQSHFASCPNASKHRRSRPPPDAPLTAEYIKHRRERAAKRHAR